MDKLLDILIALTGFFCNLCELRMKAQMKSAQIKEFRELKK